MRLFRFSPARLAYAYIALSVLVLALFATPLWYAWRANLSTFREYVQGEDLRRLVEAFDREGAKGLATAMDAHVSRVPRDQIMVFADASKRRLAGNLPVWPAEVPDVPGTYGLVIGLGGGATMRVVASHVTLPGGYHLLLGRQSVRFESLVERFWYGIGGAVGIVLVLGAVMGWLVRRSLLLEVHEVSRTASAIVEGDLTRRVPAHGGSAELDTLARTVNGMLEQLARQNGQLGHEVAVRRQAEQALRLAQDDLERLVAQRTAQLGQANESLRRSEAYLAEAQRLSHAGSWAFIVGSRQMVHGSPECFRIFGFDPEQGMPSVDTWRDRIHPDDQGRAAEILEKAIGERRDCELDARIVLPGGATRYIHAIGHPVFNAAGDPVEFVGTVIDATDRKQAEDERRAHLWFLESMDRVNRALQETGDLDQMVTDSLDVVLAIFECDRARLLYPCDPEVASDRLAMERTRPEYPGTFALGADIPTGPEVAKVYRLVLASSGPVRLDPASEHAMAPELAERLGVESMMIMAIYPKLDKPYAFVLHQCSHPRVWTPQEERLFQEIGRRLAGALDMLLMLRSLRESERKLEEAQRISHVGHWERDLAVDEYVWSEETYRIFGLWPPEGTYSFDEHQERVHPADRHLRVAALAAALQSGRYDVEYRAVRPNGEVRFVHSQGDVVRDESGRPRRLFGTVQDVTELRQAEEEIRTSEARFRTFVDHATDAFFLHDDVGAVLDVNRQACESLGYTRAELIGMTPSDFDVDVDPTLLDRIDERLRAGEIVAFDTRHRRKDGTAFPAEVRIRPFSQAGRGFRVALVRDITERKRAEQRLVAQHTVTQILAEAATLEAATPRFLRAVCECLEWDLGALWSIDGDTGVLRCVEMWHRESLDVVQFEAISRQTTFRTGIGLPGRVWSSREPVYIPDVVHDPKVPRAPIAARAGLHAAFAFPILLGGDVSGVIEFFSHEIRPPDQDLLNMMATIGSQIGLFIERKRAEEALRKVQAELAHVTRVATLGELTGSIAHEINQPLGAVVNNASACLRWLAAQNLEEARQSAARVIADGHRASEIIGRIRALAKKAPPRKDWVDINETLREVLALAQSEVQGHRVSLQTRLAGALPPVWGDRIQVQQVVLNLLVNAVEALNGVGEGPRDLCVSTDSGAAGDVVITVRDSGPGLDPQSLERLFEAFYTTKPDGLGMGLAISRSIVESHGGRLWATANTPCGAVFQFTLPPRRERAS